MLPSATHEPLFRKLLTVDDLFTKTAAMVLAKMPDDEKKWPAQIHSELLRALPYIAQYDPEIVLDRVEPEAGAALGYAQIRNRTMSRPQDDASKVGNVIRIPIIVQDRRLQPFLVFEAGGGTFPLTEDRVEQAMLNPGLFDTDARKVPSTPSLVDAMYPPYQQRQGFGRVVEPGAAGLSKLSSAPKSKDCPLSAYERMSPMQVQGALRFMKEHGGQYKGRAARGGMGVKHVWWSDKWTPFAENGFGDYLVVDSDPGPGGVKGQVVEFIHDSPQRKVRARTKAQVMGQLGSPGAKISSIPNASPDKLSLWQRATATPIRKADPDTMARAARAKKVFPGRLKYSRSQDTGKVYKIAGHVNPELQKAAMVALNFQRGMGLAGPQVFEKMTNKPKFKMGTIPQNYWFYPLQGTPFLMGIPRKLQKPLEEAKDQQTKQKMLRALAQKEIRAGIQGLPAPGFLILVTKEKQGYKYQPPMMHAGGRPLQATIEKGMRKKALWGDDLNEDDWHFAMDFSGGSQREIEEEIKHMKRPVLDSLGSRALGQAAIGAGLGGLAGGLAGKLVGGRAGRPAAAGALGLGALGGIEAYTDKGQARHKDYHRSAVAFWERTRNPAYRKRLAQQLSGRWPPPKGGHGKEARVNDNRERAADRRHTELMLSLHDRRRY